MRVPGVGYGTAMCRLRIRRGCIEAGTAVEQSPPMASTARVLIVDDEHSLRRLLRLYLEKEDYEVVEADDGLDALSLLRRGGLDLALIDVMLPELDGFEVVRRIRTESGIPQRESRVAMT